MTPKVYIPIDCNYYDLILEQITLKKMCKIVYINDTEVQRTVYARITNVFTAPTKEEFMVLENSLHIRLDKVLSIDGYERPMSLRTCKF